MCFDVLRSILRSPKGSVRRSCRRVLINDQRCLHLSTRQRDAFRQTVRVDTGFSDNGIDTVPVAESATAPVGGSKWRLVATR